MDYAIDALGSVTGTLASGSLQNVYFYKPYGGQIQKSGAGADPRFTWVGSKGYMQTNRDMADIYVRARPYSSVTGRWNSVDALWPTENAYGYASGAPATSIDPSGRACKNTVMGACVGGACSAKGIAKCKADCATSGMDYVNCIPIWKIGFEWDYCVCSEFVDNSPRPIHKSVSAARALCILICWAATLGDPNYNVSECIASCPP